MSRPNKIKGKYTPMNVSPSSNFTPTLTQVHSIEVKCAGLKIQKWYDSYTIPLNWILRQLLQITVTFERCVYCEFSRKLCMFSIELHNMDYAEIWKMFVHVCPHLKNSSWEQSHKLYCSSVNSYNILPTASDSWCHWLITLFLSS